MEEVERRRRRRWRHIRDGGKRRGRWRRRRRRLRRKRMRRGAGPTLAQYLAITARYIKNKYKLVTVFKK
jgi:hypothetical protein